MTSYVSPNPSFLVCYGTILLFRILFTCQNSHFTFWNYHLHWFHIKLLPGYWMSVYTSEECRLHPRILKLPLSWTLPLYHHASSLFSLYTRTYYATGLPPSCQLLILPSIRKVLIPYSFTLPLYSFITSTNITDNRSGLSTHPCRSYSLKIYRRFMSTFYKARAVLVEVSMASNSSLFYETPS